MCIVCAIDTERNSNMSLTKQETRTRRMTFAFPPTFIRNVDRYLRLHEKRTLMRMTRTDLIILAVNALIHEKEGNNNDA